MRCKVCHNEFGNGDYCQTCRADKVVGLGSYSGYNVSDVENRQGQNVSTQHSQAIHDSNLTMCYNCANAIPNNSEFCPSCGTKLSTKCPNCGAIFSSQYSYCNICGVNAKQFIVEQENRRRAQAEEEARRRRTEEARQAELERQRLEEERRLQVEAELKRRQMEKLQREELEKRRVEEERKRQEFENLMKNPEERLWHNAHTTNTIESYKYYINKTTTGKYDKIAISKIKELGEKEEELLWENARKTNTIESYKHYINSTKVGTHKARAQQLMHECKYKDGWMQVKQIDKLSVYKEYIQKHPNSPWKDAAERRIKQIEDNRSNWKTNILIAIILWGAIYGIIMLIIAL